MSVKQLKWNTYSSLLYQFITIICGLVLPRVILQFYGSSVNGLINSITQFLQMIAFLEVGVGAVIQSALYKPLVEKNNMQINSIVSCADLFFKKIAYIMIVYILILMIVYPSCINKEFDFWYTAILILSMSVSSFAQYYFGIVDRLLLNADQRGYIQYNISSITLVANTLISCILIFMNFSIQIVKIVTSIIYIIRPILIRIYINKNYALDRKVKECKNAIPQKLNGVAQHIAAIVLDCTDTVVLTLFSTLSNVSIYSVYFLVVSGIKQLFISAFAGVQAMFGKLWALNDKIELYNFFEKIEWILHISVVFFWFCTYKLIIPFVKLYTKGIHDTNYIVPLFALFICLAYAFYCLRISYNLLILAAGHYKQTQKIFINAAIINLSLSIILVKFFGLIGVTIGTLIAVGYQTIYMIIYCLNNILDYSLKKISKQVFVDLLEIGVLFLTFNFISINNVYLTWFSWVLLAIKTVVIVMIIMFVINLIFYKKYIVLFLSKIKK